MARFIGLDIGSFSIKVVALSKKGQGFRLETIGIALNPYGARPGADDASQTRVAEAVKKLLSDLKIAGAKAAMALDESQVYTKVIVMPVLSDSELASAIHWEAEQYVPVPLDQVNIDYEVISRPEKGSADQKMEVLLVGAPKTAVKQMAQFSEKCGVELVSLETELIAVSRSMIPDTNEPAPIMLVHLGSSSTDIAVVKSGMLVFTHSLESGGSALTRVLANELGLEFPQAEEYKRSYGLDPSQLEGKVRESLFPLVERNFSDMKKALSYYNSAHQEEPIKRVVLSGGAALLPELVSAMAESLALEVVLGNAFVRVEPSEHASIPGDTVSFATAVGLAMKEV